MAKRTIVFIHGLWIHTSAWQPWMDFFQQRGYATLNPPWPGDGATVAASRANPEAIANRGVTEVADSYAKVIATLPGHPLLSGIRLAGCLRRSYLGVVLRLRVLLLIRRR
ncbi:MAG: hypothetical protein WDO19_05195 [Bacteroidota bacterium]